MAKQKEPHVVCEPCQDCKYTDCVAVCPVECFFQDDTMLYIHPGICIACEACAPECPVEAIFARPGHDGDTPIVPDKWASYIDLNAERAAALEAAGGTLVTAKQEPKKGPRCADPSH